MVWFTFLVFILHYKRGKKEYEITEDSQSL